MTITVLIVDDHVLMRQGLAALLSEQDGVTVLGEANDGREALRFCGPLSPDVILMDVAMPGLNGADATRLLARDHPHANVLALSMHTDQISVERMLEAGAKGYVLKSSSLQEMLIAMRHVANGYCYISPEVMTPLLNRFLNRESPDRVETTSSLSTRENEVLQLIAEGLTSKGIAALLNISPRTVDNHRQNIMARLNITTVAGLTKFALRTGLTSLDF